MWTMAIFLCRNRIRFVFVQMRFADRMAFVWPENFTCRCSVPKLYTIILYSDGKTLRGMCRFLLVTWTFWPVVRTRPNSIARLRLPDMFLSVLHSEWNPLVLSWSVISFPLSSPVFPVPFGCLLKSLLIQYSFDTSGLVCR